ncbi:MAG: transcription factor RcaD, partial [Cyanobacteria bacterium P01_D01_bin.116]
KELGTKDYLPLFYLREKLQPPLSRDELDQVLFQLQADDKIELSTLQEANAYTPEQIESGIEQNVGGPLFFISVE